MIHDESMFEDSIQLVREADLFVYGRKTFQLMVPYWPDVAKDRSADKSDRDFGEAFCAVSKVVFSRSLDDAEAKKGDKNARVVRTGLRDEILKLKREPGKNIVAGGVDIPSQLIALGLVDEFRVVIHPILAGEGTRLLGGASLSEKRQLKLVHSKIYESGAVALHYLKR
jgi:dihydrofolate reductase